MNSILKKPLLMVTTLLVVFSALWILFISPTAQVEAYSPVAPIEQFAACGDTLFGLPSWHKYICQGETIEVDFEKNPGQIWLIGAAILEILIRVAGTIAFFYILYSGLRFVTSQGDSQGVADARRGLIGSLIGMGIAIIGTGTVNYLAGSVFNAGYDNQTGLLTAPASESAIKTGADVFLGIIGAISLLYIVIGAFRYVYGAGDSAQVAQARKTIVYAIVGLAVAIIAGAIISYVVNVNEI